MLNMCADSRVFVRVSKIINTLYNNYDVSEDYVHRYALVYVYLSANKMFFDY